MSITFRPSLTLDEINFLLTNIRWTEADQPALLRKLEVFTLKAKHNITKPSHVRLGPRPKAVELGFEEDTSIEILFDAWNSNPKALTPKQLERVTHHRYLADLMTPEEEAQYEATL